MVRKTKIRTRRKRQKGGQPVPAPAEKGFFDDLLGSASNTASNNAPAEKGFFDDLFGSASNTASNTAPAPDEKGFFDDLFGSAAAPVPAPASNPVSNSNLNPVSNPDLNPPPVSKKHYTDAVSKIYKGTPPYSPEKKGGGKLGLMYYATPVNGIKVAEPTYMIKGGSKRNNKRKSYKKRK